MKKTVNVSAIIIALMSIAIVFMAAGFAAYASNLTIAGTTTVTGSPWKVQFVTTTFDDSKSNVTATTTPTVSGTNVSFNVKLDKPGDSYTFDIEVENAGTIDADLTGITMSGVSAEQQAYIDYSIKYNDTTYTASNAAITGETLEAEGANHNVTVTVTYKADAAQEVLPASDVTLNLTAAFAYESK